MSTINLTDLNTGLNKIENIIETQNANKVDGIKNCIAVINTKIEEYKVLGMSSRKSRKIVKEQILGDLTNKSVVRSYNIAFTASFRGIVLSEMACKIKVSILENMLNYASVNDCNDYFVNCDETEMAMHLKSLKTRVVTSKTFEKKAK